MKSLIFAIVVALSAISIYTIDVTSITGNSIQLSSFQGKKIMLVNVASNSTDIDQMAGLERLHQLYHDSLIIIAFPSNSFNNETLSSAQFLAWSLSSHPVSFPLAAKCDVTGTNAAPVFKWLADVTKNGTASAAPRKDFYKYLINNEGVLIGIFTNEVDPLSEEIQSAITQ